MYFSHLTPVMILALSSSHVLTHLKNSDATQLSSNQLGEVQRPLYILWNRSQWKSINSKILMQHTQNRCRASAGKHCLTHMLHANDFILLQRSCRLHDHTSLPLGEAKCWQPPDVLSPAFAKGSSSAVLPVPHQADTGSLMEPSILT